MKKVRNTNYIASPGLEKALEKVLKSRDRVARNTVVKGYTSSSGKLNDDSYNDLKNKKNKEAKFSFNTITLCGVFEDKYKTVIRVLPVSINIHIDKEITPSVFIGSVIITHSDEISSIPELLETYADTMLSGIITITDDCIELFNPGDEEANIFDKIVNIENLTKEFGLYKHTGRLLSNESFVYSTSKSEPEWNNYYSNQDEIIYVVEKTQFFAKIYDDYYYSVAYNEGLNGGFD